MNSHTKHIQRYKAKPVGVSVQHHWSSLDWLLVFDNSHWLPPLAKDVVDEFGHGLGAAGASPAFLGLAAQASILHHLGEYERHLLVVFSCWELEELAVKLSRQALTFFTQHFSRVAQVLFVTHQKYERVSVPVGQKSEQGHTISGSLLLLRLKYSGFHWLCLHAHNGHYYIIMISVYTFWQFPGVALSLGALWLWQWGRRSGHWYRRPQWNHQPSGSGRLK